MYGTNPGTDSVPSGKSVAGLISHFLSCKPCETRYSSGIPIAMPIELISAAVVGQTFHSKKIFRSCLASVHTERSIPKTITLNYTKKYISVLPIRTWARRFIKLELNSDVKAKCNTKVVMLAISVLNPPVGNLTFLHCAIWCHVLAACPLGAILKYNLCTNLSGSWTGVFCIPSVCI